jgi:hypothetical protein
MVASVTWAISYIFHTKAEHELLETIADSSTQAVLKLLSQKIVGDSERLVSTVQNDLLLQENLGNEIGGQDWMLAMKSHLSGDLLPLQ